MKLLLAGGGRPRRRPASAGTALLCLAAALGAGPPAGAPDSTRSPAAAPASAASAPAAAAPAAAPAAAAPSARAPGDTAPGEALPAEASVPWKIGEYFQFSVDWSGINAGSALMQVQNYQWVEGHKVWRVISKTESNSFVSKFYKVRDRVETSIDADSLYTRKFEKHLREGGYKQDLVVRFDQEDRRALYDDGPPMDVPPRVQDVLSAFYYVRTVPLPDGAVISVPAHDNRKSYDLEVRVLKRERIEVPAGKFSCVQVEPVLKSEGIFKSQGRLLVWLTDDAKRMPIKVTSKVPIGSISVSLTDYRLAFEGRK